MRAVFEIPMKLPSANEYIKTSNNYHVRAKLKREIETQIQWFMIKLPKFSKPVFITFTWIDANAKRDIDNVCFAKKFILDALQKSGKLKNDNRKYVVGFKDLFAIGENYKVIVEIEELEDK